MQLKALRTRKGVSQQNVADYLEITRQAYSNYENGNREPDYETMLKLAEYFETTVDFILRGETEKTPTLTKKDERSIDNDDLKFALWGGADDIDDDDLEDVKRYAAFVRERKKDQRK